MGSEVWEQGLRDHLKARFDGLPRTAHPEELAGWADTVSFLRARIPDTVALVRGRGRGIGLGEQYRAPDFPEGSLSAFGTELVGHLAERVRHSVPSGWLVPHEVADLVEVLRSVLGDAVEPVLEAAREQGFVPAGN